MKENCQLRAIDDIDMIPGPVTNLDKRKQLQKNLAMLDSGWIVCKTFTFNKSNL